MEETLGRFKGNKIFVGCVPSDWTKAVLENKASDFGRVVDIAWHGSFAFITFSDYGSTIKAMNGLQRYKLKCGWPSEKRSFKERLPTETRFSGEESETRKPVKLTADIDNSVVAPLRREMANTLASLPQDTNILPFSRDKSNVELDNSVELYCTHCGKFTNNFCKKCDFPFCDKFCLYRGREVHLTFCGNTLGTRETSKTLPASYDPAIIENTSQVVQEGRSTAPKAVENLLRKSNGYDSDTLQFKTNGLMPQKHSDYPVESRLSSATCSPGSTSEKSKEHVFRSGQGRGTPRPSFKSDRSSENSGSLNAEPSAGEEQNDLIDETITAEYETQYFDPWASSQGKNIYKSVCVTVVNNGSVWMNPMSSDIYKTIEQELLDSNLKKIPLRDPQPGQACIGLYSDAWYRGRIKTICPSLTVHFIDFGNTETVEPSQVLQALPTIKNFPDLACLGKLPPCDVAKYKAHELVDHTFVARFYKDPSVDPNDVLVKIETEVLEERKHDFPSGSKVYVSAALSNDSIAVVRVDQADAYAKMSEEIAALLNHVNPPSSMPPKGNLVGALLSGQKQFVRARVLSIENDLIYVEFIDYGNRDHVRLHQIRKLPESSMHKPPGALTIWPLMDAKKKKHEAFLFWEQLISSATPLTMSYKDDVFTECQLLFNGKCFSHIGLLTNNLSNPVNEQHLASGSLVAISHVHSPRVVSIVKRDRATTAMYYQLYNDICEAFRNGRKLISLPPVDAIVAAYCSDDQNIYRARVISHSCGDALVLFVDNGKEYKVALNDMRALPKSLKTFPPFGAIKVNLKNVPKYASCFYHALNNMRKDRIDLCLEYTGKLEDGVDLYDRVNNVMINKFTDATLESKKRNQDFIVYYGNETTSVVLKEGFTDLYILSCCEGDLRENGIIYMTDLTDPSVAYVMGEMLDCLQEHCKNLDCTAYLPRKSEMCVVFNTDLWLRAICHECKDVSNIIVFFIDMGTVNKVDTTLIRPMPKFAADSPAVACPCIVKGYEKITDENGADVLSILSEAQSIKCYVQPVNDLYHVTISALDDVLNVNH